MDTFNANKLILFSPNTLIQKDTCFLYILYEAFNIKGHFDLS